MENENVNQAPQKKPQVIQAVKAVASIAVVVAIMYYPVSNFFGFSLSLGDNMLERALHVGVSDKSQFNTFMDKGGLSYESQWRGFGVQNVDLRYHENGKLGIANITLWKEGTRMKLASIENVKNSLSKECGTEWTTESGLKTNMYGAKKDGISCGLQYLGNGMTQVIVMKPNQ